MSKFGSVYQSEEWQNAVGGGINVSFPKDNPRAFLFAHEKVVSFPFFGKRKIIVAEGNPIAESEADLKGVLLEFKKVSGKYFYGTIMPTVLNPLEDIFVREGFRKVSNHTVILDLTKAEEELWKNLEKKSARWGVKTAEKNGLKFVKAEISEVGEFFEIYLKTSSEGGFKPTSEDFVRKISKSGVGQLFFVKKGKEIVAGGLFILDRVNEYAILNLTASTEEGQRDQAMPFLYWNMILKAKENGMTYFDLGGYDSEAKSGEKTFNINKFKERFGGEVREQPIFASNWKYPFLRNVLRKARFLKRMYRKD